MERAAAAARRRWLRSWRSSETFCSSASRVISLALDPRRDTCRRERRNSEPARKGRSSGGRAGRGGGGTWRLPAGGTDIAGRERRKGGARVRRKEQGRVHNTEREPQAGQRRHGPSRLATGLWKSSVKRKTVSDLRFEKKKWQTATYMLLQTERTRSS